MKVFVVFAAFVVAGVLADIPWVDPSAKSNHYSSHQGSVAEARQAVAARLAALSANNGYASSSNHAAYSGYTNAEPCTISCGTGGASSSSSHVSSSDVEQIEQQQNAGYGVGYIGFNGHDSANSEFSAQSSQFSQSSHSDNGALTAAIVLPAATGSHSQYSSSASEHVSSHASQQPSVAVLPVVSTGNAAETERFSGYTERVSESASRPLVNTVVYSAVVPSGQAAESEHYLSEHSSTTSTQQNASPIVHFPAPSATSRYVNRQHQQRYTEDRPVVATTTYVQVPSFGGAASTSSSNYANHQTSESQVHSAPIVSVLPVVSAGYPSGSERVYQRSERITTERKQPQTTTTIIYTPVAAPASESHVSRSERLSSTHRAGGSAPVGIVYQPTVRGSERYASADAHEQQYRQTYEQPSVPYTSVYPSGSNSNRYLSSSERYHSASAAQPIIAVAAVPAHSERYETESSSSRQSSNAVRAESAGGYNFKPFVEPFDIHNPNAGAAPIFGGQRPSARVGSSLFSDSYRSTDLSAVISESERLAREQSRRSGSSRGSSLISDAEFARSTSGLAGAGSSFDDNVLGLGAGNGGFVRTKQWENNEKWSSDTKYDESGRPRTFSRLSTAESELHNVNGQQTGYKAATTTLEDDGKVSTYTLHT